LLVEPNMQAASIIQQMLVQAGLTVTYRAVMPEETDRFDYVLLNLAPSRETDLNLVEQWVTKAIQLADNVIIGTPSTELALSDYLMQHHPVQCITKPLSRKKLLQLLIAHQPIQPAIQDLPITLDTLPLKVMAVDDNPANLKLIMALLQERVETVIACTNGQEAVEQASRQKFDMILMDIQMPQMDGVTACQEIKKTVLNHQTPVIAVTAHAMIGERDRLLKEGMDDYLTKPIEEHILQQVLAHWNPYANRKQLEKLQLTEQVIPSPSQEAEQPNHTIIIDWQNALKQSANKEDLAKELLQMLVDSIPQVNQVVSMALEDDEYPTQDLLHHIHKLHGSCSYSGVPRLKKVCAALEQALRSGKSISDVEPELFELQDEMDKVIATAKPYLSE